MCIRDSGILAPEVANNASVGGAIIPMIALGIPGDGTTALLLGGLTIHGIEAVSYTHLILLPFPPDDIGGPEDCSGIRQGQGRTWGV